MENSFTNDKDLMFLYDCPNYRLKALVDVIIYDSRDGKLRFTEQLSVQKVYKENYPNNIKAILPAAIDELQRYGGNTIRNWFRGHGVSYREILEKVCKQQKVNFNKAISTELLETYLLQKILMVSIEKMTEEDVAHLSNSRTMTKEMLMANIHSFFHMENPVIIKMLTTLAIKIAAKKGTTTVATWLSRFAGSRAFSILTGPIGWAVTTLWTVYDFAGPAYRVMIPATIMVAYLRMIASKTDEELNQLLN